MTMLGIPYMGSKRKLAAELVYIIRQRHPEADNFYDVFGGGGGAISFEARRHFKNVYYNELDTAIANLMRHLQTNDIPEKWYEPVTREEFHEITKDDTAYAGMVKTCWSFGHSFTSYLWGEEIEEDKLLLHELCVKNTPELIGKAEKKFDISLPKKLQGKTVRARRLCLRKILNAEIRATESTDLERVERLKIMKCLEVLQRIERLNEVIGKDRIAVTNKDYRDLEFKPNSVIYCDPPYEGTASYQKDIIDDVGRRPAFNHDDFNKWALSQDIPVYVSEYNAPKDYKLIHAITHRSILGANNNTKRVIEKLFWNGKGEPRKSTLFPS